ncbi:hypothetical protein JXA70_15285 [candidate division KSB1 bacterium]|nr:hypothetical protein [candidate division KSB1 bacterium]
MALGMDALYGSSTLKDNILFRAGLFTSGLWTNAMLRFYSHETAHEYLYRANNVHIQNALDFQQWKSSYIPLLYYPGWKQSQINPNVLNEDELMIATVSGLNQDELNADAVRLSFIERGVISFYDAQSYLLTKLRDVEYILRSGSDEAPFTPGQKIHQLQYDVYAETPHLFDDVNLYRLALLNNGVNITNKQLLNRALFADLLSWHTWESAWSLFAFMLRGDHSTRPRALRVGKNAAILPPLFSHYMTTQGSFFNSSYVLEIGNRRLVVDIGSMIGFTNIKAFQHYRVGVKVLNIKMTSFWQTSPFAFFNGKSGLNVTGHAVGFENIISLYRHVAITARAEYNRNDLLENLVKHEKNGFQLVFGVRSAF